MKVGSPACAFAGYIALYAAILTRWRPERFDPSRACSRRNLGGFSAAAWLLTVGARPLPYEVSQPAQELAVLAVYFVALTAFVTWGFDWVRRLFPADPAQSVVIVDVKLLVFVGLPAWIMRRRFGYSWRDLAPSSFNRRHILAMAGMAALLIAFQAVLGRGLRDIQAAHVSGVTLAWGLPLTFVWLALEAGVVEEFFFRCLLQSRLSSMRSELAASCSHRCSSG